MECIWIYRGSWLLIRVIVSSKPIEDPCVDQHHLKIKDGQAIVQEFCFTIQKLVFDNTCYLCYQHLYGDVESDVDHDREDYDYDQARPPRPSLGKFNNVICKERRFWC